ncbi:hypothetical protein VFPFJ_09605 [Purpureocillium lilacinum]|uniref:Uncharacterized protein n=1 Tax=Purpureocillium lilacinum TaxID=33203 RepID=A0A179GV04_PURLI|nr:hypothetical protein VFPFJ_09605 [Purpureocillium lilacinum]OAQ81150.1 hypothetical protein VFPFJ_09605 [Purpureocillium lilacinum]
MQKMSSLPWASYLRTSGASSFSPTPSALVDQRLGSQSRQRDLPKSARDARAALRTKATTSANRQLAGLEGAKREKMEAVERMLEAEGVAAQAAAARRLPRRRGRIRIAAGSAHTVSPTPVSTRSHPSNTASLSMNSKSSSQPACSVLICPRSHLVKHHSPGARNVGSRATDHAQFYMDSRQTEDVQAKIRSYKRRPRNWDDWHSYWKALFIEVWYIIFPKEHFPDLREPRSPCMFMSSIHVHLTSDEYADLGRIAKVMFEAIHDTEADRAVRANIVASKQDFCPTRDEVLDMMSKALEIVLHDSPSAVGASQWLTQSTPEALQAAVAAQYNAPEPQPGTAMAASHGTEREIDIQEFVARPLLAIEPLMREFAPFTPGALQAVPPTWPDCYSILSSNDTFAAINMKLTPTILQLLQARFQEGDQDFTLPVNFRVTITNETLFTAPVMAIMAEIDQLDTESTLGNSLPSSPQLSLMQGISMRMVQMKPLSREEHELSHTRNIPGSETSEM